MNYCLTTISTLFLVSTFASAATVPVEAPTGILKKIKDAGVISAGYSETSLPFSYLDRGRKPVGYAIDICNKVVDAIKADLKKPDLRVDMRPIKPDDAVSYIQSGVIDVHCGPILNNWARKERVEFGPTYFVQRYRYGSHESAHMAETSDMQNKKIVVPSGTAAVTALQALAASRDFAFTIVPARNSDDAFRIFREGGADAIAMDEITLAQGVAKSPELDPALVMMSDAAWGAEPYSLVYVKGDAPLKKVVSGAMQQLYTTGAVQPIYNKWFVNGIPPEGISLNLPVSETLQKVFTKPTDSPDPALYR